MMADTWTNLFRGRRVRKRRDDKEWRKKGRGRERACCRHCREEHILASEEIGEKEEEENGKRKRTNEAETVRVRTEPALREAQAT
jgi:hypothetical protein